MRLLALSFLLLVFSANAQDTLNVNRRGLPVPVADTSTIVKGELYAIVVGISTYRYLKPLDYADDDAQLFADFLRTKAGGNIKEENLILIKNDSAKSGDFWANFSRLTSKLKKGDRLFFYFAGHGDASKELDEYFLLLQDCNPGNETEHYVAGGQTIQIYNLKNRFSNLSRRGVEVLVILDACRTNELPSGHATQGFSTIAEKPGGEIMMYATGRGEVSIESPLIGNGHGLFTFYLVDGLSGSADRDPGSGNNNGEVSVTELQDWVRRKVRLTAEQKFRTKQIPFFCCPDKDYTTLVKTDSAFYEQWQNAVTSSTFNESLAIGRFRKVENTNARDSGIIAIYNRFAGAVNNLNLWGNKTSAAALYDSMFSAYPAHTITEQAGFNLAAQLMNFTQQKINLYLEAKDESIITQSISPENQEQGNEIINKQIKRQLKISSVNWGETADMYEKAIDLLQKYDSSVVRTMTPDLYFLKARQLVFSNSTVDKKRALDYAYKAFNYDRKKVYILHALGLSLSENNKYDSALLIEKQALQIAPKWSYVLYAIGLNFYELHQNDSAIYYLKQAIRINPKSELPYSGLGIVFEDMDKTDSSLYYYKEAIRINPKYEFQYNNLGVLFSKLNRYDSAVHYYKQALRLNPSYEYAVTNMAIAFEKWKKYDSALHYYKLSNQFNSNNEKLYTNMARIYLNGFNKADSAIHYYNLAITANPANTVLPVKLSNAYYRQGNYFFVTRRKADSAVHYYKEAIRLNPKSEMARYLYAGRAYYAIPKYDSALLYFKEGLQRNPDSISLYLFIGRTYKEMKQYDSALSNFHRAVIADTNYTDAFLELGEFYKDRTLYDSSIYYYSKVIRLKPEIRVVYNNLGFVYYRSAKWDSAIVYFRKAVTMNPNSESLYMNLGNSFFNSDRYDSSIAVYKEAIRINPKSENAHLSAGDAFMMLKNYDSAAYYFRQTITINSFNNLAYYKLAATYAVKKDKTNALSNLEKAFKNGFRDEKLYTDDPSFDGLRTDPDFIKLEKKYLGTE